MKKTFARMVSLLALVAGPASAWDYEGHRLVNQLALASLPADFPAFALTPAARERVAFLAGEPDRWRNSPAPTFRHWNAPDHYFDLEDLADYGLDAATLPPFRHDFTALLGVGRAAHPTNFPPIDKAKDADHTRALLGFLPWIIAESEGKLKSGFSYLKVLEEHGTPEDIANAQQNILYVMGVMGHYVGDATQPLHTTKHFNGWVGENPNGYSTNKTFHSWIDGGYLNKVGVKPETLLAKVRPARRLDLTAPGAAVTNIFPAVMKWLQEQHQLVQPLYELEKARKLSGRGEPNPESVAFLTGQLLKGGQMLGDLWLTAWKEAPTDSFLRGQLLKRKAVAAQKAEGDKAAEPAKP